jgi:hypothetical protein
MLPPKSLEPAPDGAFRSAFAVDITGPAWLDVRLQLRGFRGVGIDCEMAYIT